MYLPPTQDEVSASAHSSNAPDLRGVDTVLETEVLELGLAEATSRTGRTDENMHPLARPVHR
jgi:hypothetical protein